MTQAPKTARRSHVAVTWLGALAAGFLGAVSAAAQVAPADLPDQAVEWLQEYIRIDTVNPPGNETAGAGFFAAILEAEGIPYELVESSPGRGNIWARLPGGDAPGLVLLHHIDVVPADPDYWTAGPLSGEVRDGMIYGRGAIDTKGLGIVHLAAAGGDGGDASGGRGGRVLPRPGAEHAAGMAQPVCRHGCGAA